MDVFLSVLVYLFSAVVTVHSVPPALCFEQFKWEDCGMAPKAVIYYYKSGSRCEVGMWRGCLPNANMFTDEYECVQTCIFSQRAKPEDFHNLQVNQIDFEGTPGSEEIWETTTITDQTAENNTETHSDTDTTNAGNSTDGDVDVTATKAPADSATADPAAAETAATEPAAAEADGKTETTAVAAEATDAPE